jgi:hypothetical protein
MNKVHLWIGSNFSSEEEYLQYFKLNYDENVSTDDPTYKICDFCKDIGIRWYDEYFIGIIPRFEQEEDLDTILEEAAVDIDELDRIKETCSNLGIEKANAIFWYQDAELEISKPYKENYSGLKYIGVFEGD